MTGLPENDNHMTSIRFCSFWLSLEVLLHITADCRRIVILSLFSLTFKTWREILVYLQQHAPPPLAGIETMPGISLDDKGAWDDSALIKSWDEAVAEYEVNVCPGNSAPETNLSVEVPQHPGVRQAPRGCA